jgi:alpha-beta hydrolase superfamily lysophospholipase
MNKVLLALLTVVVCAPCAGEDFRVEEVRFPSHGAALAGSIVLPPGEIRAGVVFIHGSGKQERSLHWAKRFAEAGIGALVYDKRGTGKSGGEYEADQSVGEKNLVRLADDASEALHRLAEHLALKDKPLGFAGISQAGWIAPLAAEKNPLARFLVLWSGPVCKVSEEDIYSKHTADRDGKFALPYAEALKARKQKYIWPDFLGKDTDPVEMLARLSIRGLWIFSDNDTSVPVDLSIARLQALRLQGHAYDYVLFSGLGHNNMDTTFVVATEWIRHLK